MKFIADLHIHSKYSRATAKNLDFESLYYTAQIKGVNLIGTGDFTHPAWIEEIITRLEPSDPGLFSLKKNIADKIDKQIPETCRGPVRFILQAEISNIYKKGDRVRKNHNLVYFPGIDSVRQFNSKLDAIGNIKSDGRPILGLDAADLLEIMLETDDSGFFIPAHIWTPWFSMFGSKSGFDSMEECFGKLKNNIFAVETGLSSDPPMNWRVEDLDDMRLISSSDAHSPGYLGRNASVFDTQFSFEGIRNALQSGDQTAFQGTLDMYPHQGKYHFDGHRKCGVCLDPAESLKLNNRCPVCGKILTLGVLNRVQELATRPEGYQPPGRHGFKSIIPLPDILSEIFGVGPKTKKVSGYYQKAVEKLGPELGILVDQPIEAIEKAGVPMLSQAIDKMRTGNISIDPGFDGEFGKVRIFTDLEKETPKGEGSSLFKLPSGSLSRKDLKNIKAESRTAAKGRQASDGRAGKKRKKIQDRAPSEPARKSDDPDLLESLNKLQKKAVESEASAIIVQAGPGTGKTRTLTAKIAHLVSHKNVEPDSILALTFTNKAAQELGQRMQKYLPQDQSNVTASTFHAFCLNLLKTYHQFDGAIGSDDFRISLLQRLMGQKATKKEARKADRLICMCKQNLIFSGEKSKDLNEMLEKNRGKGIDIRNLAADLDVDLERFTALYGDYNEFCRSHNLADFEDLIPMAVGILIEDQEAAAEIRNRFRYVFIDEYQDLNFGQYQFVKLLCRDARVFVIGDPDQSIYGFRGSDNKYFRQFEKDFPGCEKIVFNRNYRSTQTILDASFQMITRNSSRNMESRIFSSTQKSMKLVIRETPTDYAEAVAIGKTIEKLVGGTSFLSIDSGKAGLETEDEYSPEKEYAFSDIAVLFRTSVQGRLFMEAFEKHGIPCHAAAKNDIYELNGIKQLLSLCRIVCSRASFMDYETILDYLGIKVPDGSVTDAASFQKLIEGKEGGTGPISKLVKNGVQTDIKDFISYICENAGLLEIIQQDEKIRRLYDKISVSSGQFDDLTSFIDHISLDQDTDTLAYDTQKVSLMTMHAAKGLEFPVVFVAGCEQGMIPYFRSGNLLQNKKPMSHADIRKQIDMEEERRLFYVAMTRAMDILYLTHAKSRMVFGKSMKMDRSCFIDDIEAELTRKITAPVYVKPVKKARQLELF